MTKILLKCERNFSYIAFTLFVVNVFKLLSVLKKIYTVSIQYLYYCIYLTEIGSVRAATRMQFESNEKGPFKLYPKRFWPIRIDTVLMHVL